MSSIQNIGISGLRSAQSGLLTASHNISNANTPGYNRQQIVQSTNNPLPRGSGFVGQGVQVTTVQRIYSQFLTSQALQVQTQSSQLSSYYNEIKQIDNLLADTSSGLSPAMQNFFSAAQDVATNPTSIPSRQALLSHAQILVGRLQEMDQHFSEMRDGVNKQLTSNVEEINVLATQIAKLNINIQTAEGVAGGQPANDLRDQRDLLLRELSQFIKVDVVRQDNGHYNVFVGSGQALVVGDRTMTLKTVVAPDDAQRLTVALDMGNKTILLPEHQLQGGSLGGLFAFREETLDSTQNTLGLIALGLAQTFNDQHRLGQDLHGLLGGDFFHIPEPGVQAASGNDSASSVTVAVSDVGALTASDYRFEYDGTNYTLTRLSDNFSVSTPVAPDATPLTLDGLSITDATIQSGEHFLIQPTRQAAQGIGIAIQDPARIAAAAPIRTEADIANTGTATISAGRVNSPLDTNLQKTVTITFQSSNLFKVTGDGLPTDDQTYKSGEDISFNGWSIQIDGKPAAGDTFVIRANTNGVADNRNALLMAGLQTQNSLLNETASFQSTYASLVSQVGSKTRELEVMNRAQTNMLAQVDQSIQSLSGVNLEEEAANLLRYQQAFQAASKVIEISNSLFDTLLRI
ncbi:flagellar hook-associated protein FlgK [Nitrosomonas halophila]|uniref:Flagellar hook-associated protein 1 n=1 Tax=Nitrosomonas halophila TaxID=44576 RepID=A0A1H3H5U1_9PROT|nr:flagellar hook-associated protein FlgK [Nitrosomonas halophila]SDY10882.1 flagellar hook-associated protein 1 FlgK [Nitrosomonas halophila]